MLCPLCLLTLEWLKVLSQRKHAVNSTLMYFNSTPTACLSAFNHGSWLSDLFYVCLFILFQNNLSGRTVTQFCITWSCSSVHWHLDIFGILSSLSLEALRGKKENKMHTIKLRNSWWTNPASCFLLLISVSSLMYNILSTSQQYLEEV